jgi:hypothetical protein
MESYLVTNDVVMARVDDSFNYFEAVKNIGLKDISP